jgi:hydrogenase small subunit
MEQSYRMKAPESIQMNRPPAVKEIHVIWMTTGLSCDGDSVSITAASQPSIEDLVMGNIPGSLPTRPATIS